MNELKSEFYIIERNDESKNIVKTRGEIRRAPTASEKKKAYIDIGLK